MDSEQRRMLREMCEAASQGQLNYGQWVAESPRQLWQWFRNSIKKGEGHQPWVVHTEHAERGPETVCITGNGLLSEANARVFAVAVPSLLHLLDEYERYINAHAQLVNDHNALADSYKDYRTAAAARIMAYLAALKEGDEAAIESTFEEIRSFLFPDYKEGGTK